jgi:hypothetical protein
MRLISFCLLGLISIAPPAHAIEPETRIHCANDQGTIDIDLYATGHPMGGITMFSGLMLIQMKSVGSRLLLHVRTSPSKVSPDGFELSGESTGLDMRDVRLTFQKRVSTRASVSAALEVSGPGPFDMGMKPVATLSCDEVVVANSLL